MSVETRPTDQITPAHLLIGMPYVEFGALDAVTGAYDPYRNLGIVDSAEIQKTLTAVQLVSAQSGIQTLIRELIARIEARMQIGVFNFDPYNMQLFLGSSSLTSVSGGAATATDEPFTLTDDTLDFIHLDHANITSVSAVSAAEVEDELVGVGDGTLGDASGDYTLDYKVELVADVTSVTVAGVAYTPIAVGTAASGLEVEVVVGTGATSGDLQFFSGGSPVNVTGTILATYEPSWAMVLNTDYFLDIKEGRIRVVSEATKATGTAKWIYGQPMECTYNYTEVAHDEIKPLTQTTFAGRARVRLLTDVGINIIWTIPSAAIQLTDDPFAFSRDEFGIGNLQLTVYDAGGTDRYGTMKMYDETP